MNKAAQSLDGGGSMSSEMIIEHAGRRYELAPGLCFECAGRADRALCEEHGWGNILDGTAHCGEGTIWQQLPPSAPPRYRLEENLYIIDCESGTCVSTCRDRARAELIVNALNAQSGPREKLHDQAEGRRENPESAR